ncbi:hypothetical protein L1276_004204 [Flavobacterium sp. HSC-32F16]|uniref:hypothetical protein n=1 Tax=Flavobacterium sp. HSC-32F16 TaxID=2910964 RepID=UPI0020A51736|nr:hypothetical protein [Flavobacterium sp. HSC-32F16]MCP2029025.1 hypothetical protein [Flavobacterium sp. HSC-32F16]
MTLGKILNDFGEIKHFIYEIQKGDTPESVADKLEMTLYELRSYHNFNCIENIDVINAGFPSHLGFLLLNPKSTGSNKEQEELKPVKVVFDNEFTIPFSHVIGKNSYKVFLAVENDKQLQSVSYKVSVEFIKRDKNGYSLFEIDRVSKVFLNNNVIEKIVDTVAEEVSTILYPLLIVVNPEGKWVDIHNFNDIVERWTEKRKKIAETKEGIVINKYFNTVDFILENPDNLLKNVSDDWFLNMFFNGIHTGYTLNFSFTNQADFSLTPKDDVLLFNVTQKINEYLNDAGMIVIEKKGLLADWSEQTTPFNNISSGNYHSIHHLNPNSYAIENISLECDILGDYHKKVFVKIYNLNDTKIVPYNKKESFFVEEKKKKESFFKDLFKLHY